jgi:hypothetical protein
MNAGFGARFFLGAAFLAAFFGAALRAVVFLAAVFLAAFFGAAFLALVAVFLAAGRFAVLLAERFAGFAFAFFADFFAAITISECVKGTENDVGRKISYTLFETVCKRFLSGEMMNFLWGNDARTEIAEEKHGFAGSRGDGENGKSPWSGVRSTGIFPEQTALVFRCGDLLVDLPRGAVDLDRARLG